MAKAIVMLHLASSFKANSSFEVVNSSFRAGSSFTLDSSYDFD
jgi:hypothetical protein